MKSVLLMVQFFGLMPVLGMSKNDVYQLKFSWIAFRTVYAIFCCVSVGFYAVLTFLWMIENGIEFSRLVPNIFYFSNVYVMFCFLFLARRWPDLSRQWRLTEGKMNQSIYPIQGLTLRSKIRLVAVIILSMSLTEHILSTLTNMFYVDTCPNVDNKVKALFKMQYSQLFSFTYYSLPKALYARFINTIGTLCWSFMDLFVILVSIGISSLFRKLNHELLIFKGKNLPKDFWEQKRFQYRTLCDLCELVDNSISKITIISFSNNLFFICVQLLNSMNPLPSNIHIIYFWFSLIFLIGRTLAVSLYSAQINDESKRILEVLRVVPVQSWTVEVKRFYDEVSTDLVALSGMKFFYLTRRLVLSVAGTIVTYELVLIQFDQDDDINVDDPCAPIYYSP